MSNAKNPEEINPASVEEQIELDIETDENDLGYGGIQKQIFIGWVY